MQWARRRRGISPPDERVGYLRNPYFLPASECKLSYDKDYNVVGFRAGVPSRTPDI